MKTAVIEAPKSIQIKEIPKPGIKDDEVLVRLQGSGLCISNLPVWQGREWFDYPLEPGAPGHEGYGIVEETGSKVTEFEKGDRVSLISYHAYAEYDKAPASNVVKIPESFKESPFPGEPAACAVNIFKRSAIESGQNVVVIGAGYIGCMLIQQLNHAGANVIAVSRRNSSLAFAEQAGAKHLVRFEDVDKTAKAIMKISGGEVPRIIEATGVQPAIDLATQIIENRGRLIIAGFHQDSQRKIDLQTWNWKGIDVINAHERDPATYTAGLKEAVEKAKMGILEPHELITHNFHLSEIKNAFETLDNKPEGFLKAIITI